MQICEAVSQLKPIVQLLLLPQTGRSQKLVSPQV